MKKQIDQGGEGTGAGAERAETPAAAAGAPTPAGGSPAATTDTSTTPPAATGAAAPAAPPEGSAKEDTKPAAGTFAAAAAQPASLPPRQKKDEKALLEMAKRAQEYYEKSKEMQDRWAGLQLENKEVNVLPTLLQVLDGFRAPIPHTATMAEPTKAYGPLGVTVAEGIVTVRTRTEIKETLDAMADDYKTRNVVAPEIFDLEEFSNPGYRICAQDANVTAEVMTRLAASGVMFMKTVDGVRVRTKLAPGFPQGTRAAQAVVKCELTGASGLAAMPDEVTQVKFVATGAPGVKVTWITRRATMLLEDAGLELVDWVRQKFSEPYDVIGARVKAKAGTEEEPKWEAKLGGYEMERSGVKEDGLGRRMLIAGGLPSEVTDKLAEELKASTAPSKVEGAGDAGKASLAGKRQWYGRGAMRGAQLERARREGSAPPENKKARHAPPPGGKKVTTTAQPTGPKTAAAAAQRPNRPRVVKLHTQQPTQATQPAQRAREAEVAKGAGAGEAVASTTGQQGGTGATGVVQPVISKLEAEADGLVESEEPSCVVTVEKQPGLGGEVTQPGRAVAGAASGKGKGRGGKTAKTGGPGGTVGHVPGASVGGKRHVPEDREDEPGRVDGAKEQCVQPAAARAAAHVDVAEGGGDELKDTETDEHAAPSDVGFDEEGTRLSSITEADAREAHPQGTGEAGGSH
jgi:hypothetical protein